MKHLERGIKCTMGSSELNLFVPFAVLLLLSLFSVADSAEVNVHPTNCNEQHNDSQMTLNEALRAINKSETTLNLLPGVHCITSYVVVGGRGQPLRDIQIRGESRENVTIVCTPGNGLAFLNITGLIISGVTIKGCGLNQEHIYTFIQDVIELGIDFFYSVNTTNDSIAILCAEITHFTMTDSSVVDTNGLGLLGVNIQGESIVDNVHFINNTPSVCFYEQARTFELEQIGGGALFLYNDYLENGLPQIEQRHTLSISNSNFSYNSYCGIQTLLAVLRLYNDDSVNNDDLFLGGGGGLSIIYTQFQYKVNTTISNSHFQNNTARYGGGAQIQVYSGVNDSHVVFKGCTFEKNGLGDELYTYYNFTTSGGGISFYFDFIRSVNNTNQNSGNAESRLSSTLTVLRSNFTENVATTGGAAQVFSLFASLLGGLVQNRASFEDCRFERNVAVIGSTLYLQEWKRSATQRGLNIDFKNVTIEQNLVNPLTAISSASQTSAAVEAQAVNITIRGVSKFQHNLGTALRCVTCIIHFEDDVMFKNNTGLYAGALRVETGGLIVVNNNTNLQFMNNSGAVLGGAIFVTFGSTVPAGALYNDCFLYFGNITIYCFNYETSQCSDISELNVNIEFDGNTAPLGAVMYGSTLENCSWAAKLRNDINLDQSVSILEFLARPESEYSLFTFSDDQVPDSIASVTTETNRIVIENENRDSINSIDIVPGQIVDIYVKLLDRFNRPAPGVITSVYRQRNTDKTINPYLGQSNYWFVESPVMVENSTNQTSFRAPFTVYGSKDREDINISLFTIDSLAQTDFSVNLRNCSPGFEFKSGLCVCNDKINQSSFSIQCESNGNLSVTNEVWIGYAPDGETLVIVSCQFDYCEPGLKRIKPPDFDSLCQRDFHRSGIACGQCAENYSIVFGSNKCAKCSNYWLFFIPIFLLQGIIIIAAICYLKITVSEGYLNGMLFYANIVSVFIPIFSSSTNVSNVFVLVSWLNLDWGIPTCFYDGMTALQSTVLEFCFPLYLYFLMLLITLIAKSSKSFSEWLIRRGFTVVKLFATLIVMTYTSLLQTCVEILGVTRFTAFDGTTYVQWKRDPNQGYFQGFHIPLGLLAILILAFFLVPLPFFLFFPSIVFRVRRLQRFKPLYDAFWAPFKPVYRFWVGLRLLLRALPILFLSFFSLPLNVYLLGIFALTLMWVQSILQPFRGAARNNFDNFFLANVVVLASGYLYLYIFLRRFDLLNQRNVTHLVRWDYGYFFGVVFTAYVAFILIIIWHIILRFPRLRNRLSKYKIFTLMNNNELQVDDKSYGSSTKEAPQVLVNENRLSEGSAGKPATYSELREPLLESGFLEHTETNN